MQAFPSLDELLLNPVVAAAVVVAIVNVVSYAAGVKPNWLAVAVSLAYMVGGYFVTGRRAPDELFLAVVYGMLIVAPLAHVDGAVLSRLFGGGGSIGMRLVGESRPQFFKSGCDNKGPGNNRGLVIRGCRWEKVAPPQPWERQGSGAVGVAVVDEASLKGRLNHLAQGMVTTRSQRAQPNQPALRLVDVEAVVRAGLVGAAAQIIAQLQQVAFQIELEARHRRLAALPLAALR